MSGRLLKRLEYTMNKRRYKAIGYVALGILGIYFDIIKFIFIATPGLF